MESKVDEALVYMLFLTRHIPAGDVSAATLALLIEMGFKTNVDGFCYLRNAILMKIERPGARFVEIYSEVGRIYGGGASFKQVERAVRFAIESTWKKRRIEACSYFFSDMHIGRKGCPSDSVFIAQIACVMELWCSCCKEVDCSE